MFLRNRNKIDIEPPRPVGALSPTQLGFEIFNQTYQIKYSSCFLRNKSDIEAPRPADAL